MTVTEAEASIKSLGFHCTNVTLEQPFFLSCGKQEKLSDDCSIYWDAYIYHDGSHVTEVETHMGRLYGNRL
jgi:hypothetical protein